MLKQAVKISLGVFFIILGIIGMILPVMPGVIFIFIGIAFILDRKPKVVFRAVMAKLRKGFKKKCV